MSGAKTVAMERVDLLNGAPYVEDVKGLMREYTAWFGRDLDARETKGSEEA